MFDFNESKNTYVSSIEESINFVGKDLDFFVTVKASLLKKTIKKLLPHVKRPRILDIGCGHGLIHRYLPNDTFEVVGVDVADEVLDLARQSNAEVTYLTYDGKALPFQSESFDVAIALCVMHHVPPSQWGSFLVEMRRILKKDGIAVVFEHNPYNPVTRYIVANSPLDKGATLLRSSDLKQMMNQVGLESAKSDYILFTPFSPPIFRWLDTVLKWCPLGAQYYTISKR